MAQKGRFLTMITDIQDVKRTSAITGAMPRRSSRRLDLRRAADQRVDQQQITPTMMAAVRTSRPNLRLTLSITMALLAMAWTAMAIIMLDASLSALAWAGISPCFHKFLLSTESKGAMTAITSALPPTSMSSWPLAATFGRPDVHYIPCFKPVSGRAARLE